MNGSEESNKRPKPSEDVSQKAVAGGSQSAANSSRASRRVDPSQRRRVPASCDRCKVRKIRCIRPLGSESVPSTDSDPCAACAQLGLACVVSLPRKHRVYASFEQLSVRYRALDGLVRSLLPDTDIDKLEDLLNVCKQRGVEIANGDDGDWDPVSEMAESGQGADRQEHLSSGTVSEGSLAQEISSLRIPEGTLIPAPRGGFHYVGPASSYQFANALRHLVTKSNARTIPFDRTSFRRQLRAVEFASHDRTTALEARIEGHPITTATNNPDGGEDASEPHFSPLAAQSGPSPFDTSTPKSAGVPVSDRLRDVLPTRATADILVKSFFTIVHPTFNLFHRGSFQARYEAVWSSRSSTPDPGWICALLMVFVHGAQAAERDGLSDATALQGKYLSMVIRDGLQRLVLTATLSNVQALLLLSLYEYNAGERNTAWMLVGQSTRMAIALGLQRNGENTNFDPIERNVRRMVWWTLHLFDQNISLVLGRPCSTEGLEVSTPLPDGEMTDGGDLPPDYLSHAISLSAVSVRVKRFAAVFSSSYQDSAALTTAATLAKSVFQQLVDWQNTLPRHLWADYHFAIPKHHRIVLLLHVHYQYLRSVVCRPFLLCAFNDHLEASPTNTLAPVIFELSNQCLLSAKSTMDHLLTLSNHNQLEGEVWYDYYYVHHASLILSLPFLVKTDPDSPPSASYRAVVSSLLNQSQRMALSPTYRILMGVSMQFAKIVGIGPEDDPSRPPSPPSHTQALPGITGHFNQEQPLNLDPWSWATLNLATNNQPPALTLDQLLGFGIGAPMAAVPSVPSQGFPQQDQNNWNNNVQSDMFNFFGDVSAVDHNRSNDPVFNRGSGPFTGAEQAASMGSISDHGGDRAGHLDDTFWDFFNVGWANDQAGSGGGSSGRNS